MLGPRPGTDPLLGLVAQSVSTGYEGRRVLHDVSVTVNRGRAMAVVGPNGAGKTTLLRVLAGTLPVTGGCVEIDGVSVSTMRRRDLARRVAVVPQRSDIGFGLTGRQVVMLGRTPFLGRLALPKPEDVLAVNRAIDDTETAEFAHRPMSKLSGGEAQRIILAMALAQDASYLLLDEPLLHLDLAQQWKFLERVRYLCESRGVGVLAILHDVRVAAESFDEVMLLAGGRTVAVGRPRETLTTDNLSRVFGISEAQGAASVHGFLAGATGSAR